MSQDRSKSLATEFESTQDQSKGESKDANSKYGNNMIPAEADELKVRTSPEFSDDLEFV